MRGQQQQLQGASSEQPMMKGLAASVKHILSPRGKQQHTTAAATAAGQDCNRHHAQHELWQRWCGCAAASCTSSFACALADAYLETPISPNRASGSLITITSMQLVADSQQQQMRTVCEETDFRSFVSPPSTIVSARSGSFHGKHRGPHGPSKPAHATAKAAGGSPRFSSCYQAVLAAEHAADLAWRDFQCFRVTWLQASMQHRFSWQEADLDAHEQELLHRLQQGSAVTCCDSDELPPTAPGSAAVRSCRVPAAGSFKQDWQMFADAPDLLWSADSISKSRKARRMARSGAVQCAA